MVNWRPILRFLLTFVGGALLFLLTKYFIKYKSISSPKSSSNQRPSTSSHSSHSNNKRKTFNIPKRIVCSTRNVCILLINKILLTDGENNNDIKPIESSFHSLHQLLNSMKSFDIYFITVCNNDETEKYVVQLFDSYLNGSINHHKILFCSTDEGRIHMARHIEPDTYIDDDINLIMKIKRFIPQSIHINPILNESNSNDDIFTFDSLESFVNLILQSKN